jgi:flagellar motor switch protein FliG
MLIFDDIKRVDSRGMQILIRYSDKSILPKALKFVDDNTKNCFFDNMSARAAKILIEEIDNSNNIRLEESELAQKNILLILRELMNKGQVALRDIIKDSD